MTKFVVAVSLVALFLCQVQAVTEAPELEQSTESPIADMALIGDSVMAPKTPTEKPPVAPAMAEKSAPVEALEKSAAVPAVQPHTVADFIIHPLIAFKPRQASLDEIQGKQAQAPATGAPATSGTWLFGMNPAQQLGSSFSTLAGSVSGWFNDRLAAAGQQIPQSFVETPVRESSTTSSTTTTTTQRPDIVVRVQQRPQRNGNRKGNGNANGNGNGNLNNNFNGNGNGNRRRQRPNRYNNRLDSLEDEYYDEEDDYFLGNRFDEEFDDEDEDDLSLEQFEDEDSLEAVRPQKKRKQTQAQVQNQRRKFGQQNQEAPISQKRRPATQNKKTQKTTQQKKQPVQVPEDSEDEEELDDDENINNDDDVEDEEEIVDDDSQEQDYAQEPAVFGSSSTSTRRSQNQPNFIQRGQQSIISQIRQFTRGQTPGELGNTFRRSQVGGNSGKTRSRPQQATLVVNRNGQTVYVAPELANGYPYAYQGKKQRVPVSGSYPQPPLTVPIRRQGRPTQYITIPWSQLGLSPPESQSVVSLAEGIQAQPLILNIPQSAINPVRTGATTNGQKKKKRPQLTAAAVPLLADASLMDIFQPPQIPPSRTGSTSTAAIKPITAQPVLIAAKPVKAGGSGLLPTRIRPGTIVEKAPAMETVEKMPVMEVAEMKPEQEMLMASTEVTPQQAANGEQQEFIIVGEDDEPGLSRHVQPAYGDARYVSYGDFHPYFDLLTQNRRFALRKSGRSLESPEEVQKVEVQKEEVQKEEVQKEEVQKVEVQKEEVQKEEVQKEEVPKEEVAKKEVPKEAPKEELAQEEPKQEELPKEVETPKEDQPQSKLL
ncbi:hypothetical protein KR074_010708 [Drosophila pseudoananassae]|nr:hypothetical protein KR074_010708 [Drosophila pseudoananassae]